jgi:uridine kinase
VKNVDTVTKVSAEVLFAIQSGVKPNFLSDGVASVVAVSGAAALGKTTFARELAVSLNNQGTTAALVELDGFLLERSKRRKLDLSGYSPDATDLGQLSDSLHQLVVQARAVDIPVYDHKYGGHKGRVRVIPREVIILDGIVSLSDHVRDKFVSYGVFLNAKPLTMRGLRLRVDTGERGYSIWVWLF